MADPYKAMDRGDVITKAQEDGKKQLLLISGKSASGKSASLRTLPNQSRWIYVNCESQKPLPFKNDFTSVAVTDPYQLDEVFEEVAKDDYDGVIIDSLTFLMDMFESLYIYGASDGRSAWSDYQQYFKNLMQQQVGPCKKHVVFLAHTRTEQDAALNDQTSVPVKGALKSNGVESFFSIVISTKTAAVKDLKEQKESDLLNILPVEEALGMKYVYQTTLTKNTMGERIRGPMGLFDPEAPFMDNDLGLVLEHMIRYYG